jgi:hypothetical protein
MNLLESVLDEELFEGFKLAGDNFLDFVDLNARPKKIKGNQLIGRSFVSLAKTYIKAVKEKNICIESTYQYVIAQENNKAVDDASNEMELIMKAAIKTFPLSAQSFIDVAREAQSVSMAVFLKAAVNVEKHPDFQLKLEAKFKQIVETYCSLNEEISSEKCAKVGSDHARLSVRLE